MAQLERLIARIEADTTILRREMNRAGLVVDRGSRRMDRNLQRIDRRFDGLGASARRLQGVLAGLGLAFGAREFVQAADTMTLLSARIGLVTKSSEEAGRVMETLFDISQETRQSFEKTTEIYARLARSSEQVGLSQQELLDITRAVNQAVLVSGATAQEAGAAMIQFAQGMASGELRGEELRSVMEQMPRLARAIADGLGTTIGGLREMAEAGEMTIERVVRAIQSQMGVIAREAGQMERTVGQAFQQLENAFLRAIGISNEASEGVGKFTEVLDELREIVEGEGFQAGMNFLVEAFGALAGEIAKSVEHLGNLVNLAKDPSLENLGKAAEGTFFGRLADVLGLSGGDPRSVRDIALSRTPYAEGLSAADRHAERLSEPMPGVRLNGLRPLPKPARSSAGGGGGSTDPKITAMEALDAVRQVEASMQRSRQKALGAINDIEESYLQATGQEIALIKRRRDAQLAALDELLLSEEEKERARRLIIINSDAEIAAHRRRVQDDIKEAQRQELDLVNALKDEIKGPLHQAMRGHIQDWQDVGRAALNVLANIAQRWVDLQIEMSKVGSGDEGGFGWGSILGGLGGLVGGIGGLFGGGGAGAPPATFGGGQSLGPGLLPARAGGGDVYAGQAYKVGEMGRPEIFVPQMNGRVVPVAANNNGSGGMGGDTFVVNEAPITINGSTMDEARLAQVLKAHRQETIAEVARLARRGGSFAKAFQAA